MDRFYLLFDGDLAAISHPQVYHQEPEPLLLSDGTVVPSFSGSWTIEFETTTDLPDEFEVPPVVVDMDKQHLAIRLVDAFLLIHSENKYVYLIREPARYTTTDYLAYRAQVLYRLHLKKQEHLATGFDLKTFSNTPVEPGPFWDAYQQGLTNIGNNDLYLGELALRHLDDQYQDIPPINVRDSLSDADWTDSFHYYKRHRPITKNPDHDPYRKLQPGAGRYEWHIPHIGTIY